MFAAVPVSYPGDRPSGSQTDSQGEGQSHSEEDRCRHVQEGFREKDRQRAQTRREALRERHWEGSSDCGETRLRRLTRIRTFPLAF